MNSSTTNVSIDIPKQFVEAFLRIIDDGTKQVAHSLWLILLDFLAQHWLAVLLTFIVLMAIAMAHAMMGRWGMLGSLLYNFLYFSILFIIGLIWGPEVFVSDVFHAACTAILYPLCYVAVGLILDKFGLRRRI